LGAEHDRLDAAGDRFQIRIGPIPLDLRGIWVDGVDVVATLAQPAVHVVAPCVFGVRDTPVTATRLLARKADAPL